MSFRTFILYSNNKRMTSPHWEYYYLLLLTTYLSTVFFHILPPVTEVVIDQLSDFAFNTEPTNSLYVSDERPYQCSTYINGNLIFNNNSTLGRSLMSSSNKNVK